MGQSLLVALLAAMFCLTPASAEAEEPETVRLVGNPQGQLLTRTRSLLQASGTLKLNADGTAVTELPLSVRAELLYDERRAAGDADDPIACRALRYYHESESTMQVGEGSVTTSLSPAEQIMAFECSSEQAPLFYSPTLPLSQESLDLVNLPGNSALLLALLPGREVAVGESWGHDENLLAWLLNLEHVTDHQVESTLSHIQERTAVIRIAGELHGAVNGVSTVIDLQGEYQFDLDAQIVSGVALSVEEDRSISHATPGFVVTAELRSRTACVDRSPWLQEVTLPEEVVGPTSPQALLLLESDWLHLGLLHDRRWQVMVDRSDLLLMRLTDRGDLVAQLNLSNLPNLDADTQMRPEAFQQQVQQALGDSLSQIVETTEETTESGLHLIRVVATGSVEDLAIQWIYYHISQQDGRRLSCVFTLEVEQSSRFGVVDHAIASSINFLPQVEVASTENATENGPNR